MARHSYADVVRETARLLLGDPAVNATDAYTILLEYADDLHQIEAVREAWRKADQEHEAERESLGQQLTAAKRRNLDYIAHARGEEERLTALIEDYKSRCEVEFHRAERWEAEATRLSMDLQQQDAQLVEMRQAYEACKREASKCHGCDAYLSVCEEYREQGFTSCCPECKHG